MNEKQNQNLKIGINSTEWNQNWGEKLDLRKSEIKIREIKSKLREKNTEKQ